MPNSSTATNSGQPTYGMDLTDDALVTFTGPVNGGVGFTDTGFMPVTELTVDGKAAPQPNGLSGEFISYTGTGVQNANGITYNTLNYELIGYTGRATFNHAADGTPTVTGAGDEVVLAHGSLIGGSLAFQQNGGIGGEVEVTVLFGKQNVGNLDISVQHSASDIHYLFANGTGAPPSGLTLSNGSLQATFIPLQSS